jgi:hypothetical protein
MSFRELLQESLDPIDESVDEAKIPSWGNQVVGSLSRIGIKFLIDVFWEPDDPFKVRVHAWVNPSFGYFKKTGQKGGYWARGSLPGVDVPGLSIYKPLNNIAQHISAFIQRTTHAELLALQQEKQHRRKTDPSKKKKTGPKGPWKYKDTDKEPEDVFAPSQIIPAEIMADIAYASAEESLESILTQSLDEASILDLRPGIRFMIDIFLRLDSPQLIDYNAMITFTAGTKQGGRYHRGPLFFVPAIYLNGKLDTIIHRAGAMVQLKTYDEVKKEMKDNEVAAKAASKRKKSDDASVNTHDVKKGMLNTVQTSIKKSRELKNKNGTPKK